MERDPVKFGAELLTWFAVAIVVLSFAMSGLDPLGAASNFDENKAFDKIQAAFDADRDSFVSPLNYLEQLKAANPGAEQIGWTGGRLCITSADSREECREETPEDDAAFDPLPGNTNGVYYYAKDPDRVFIVFNRPEGPVVYLMYAPLDENPGDFADERGFGTYRELGDAWTLLGDIYDSEAGEAQFPQPQFPDDTW